MRMLGGFLKSEEAAGKAIYPPAGTRLAALALTPLPAVRVVVMINAKGTNVTQAYFPRPSRKSHVVTTVRAIAARIWLAMPNIGQMV